MKTILTHDEWQVQNARDLIPTATLEADVVVIGTGAGGGISAEVLAQQGYKVLLLEEGPYRDSQDFNMVEKKAYADLYQESSARKTKDKSISILQGRNVGGSTTVNWTSSFRTPEKTLRHWQEKYSLSDLSADLMVPWFDDVEKRLSVSEWKVPPNENNQTLMRGMKKLGWSYSNIPRNVKGCANLGYCGMGCPINAKQSMLVTTIPSALSAGARLLSRARAEKFNFANGKITSVQVQPLDNKGHNTTTGKLTIRARHFILSAGAIGSPALLMRSNAPDPYATLGSRTFLHPVSVSAAIMPDAVNGFAGAPQSVYSDEFLWRDGVEGELGYKLEVPPLHPLIVSTFVPGHGLSHRKLLEQFPSMQAIVALHRDGFHPQSIGGQVELNQHNLPVLDYPVDGLFWRAARNSLLRMAEIQFAAGAKGVLPMHSDAELYSSWAKAKKAIEQLPLEVLKLTIFSAHVMGGCAMGSNEKSSVTDSYGKHHQIDNLTINDASLFPTSLGVNPQLTTYALSKRNVSHLVKNL